MIQIWICCKFDNKNLLSLSRNATQILDCRKLKYISDYDCGQRVLKLFVMCVFGRVEGEGEVMATN